MPRKKPVAPATPRRKFTEEFRRKAVQLLLDGHSAPAVAERLGLSSPNLLYVWKRNSRERASPLFHAEPIAVKHRIVLNYYTAKRLLHALHLSVGYWKYAPRVGAFGVLETDVNNRVVARPGGSERQNWRTPQPPERAPAAAVDPPSQPRHPPARLNNRARRRPDLGFLGPITPDYMNS